MVIGLPAVHGLEFFLGEWRGHVDIPKADHPCSTEQLAFHRSLSGVVSRRTH
jgi:hypothetical protein